MFLVGDDPPWENYVFSICIIYYRFVQVRARVETGECMNAGVSGHFCGCPWDSAASFLKIAGGVSIFGHLEFFSVGRESESLYFVNVGCFLFVVMVFEGWPLPFFSF